MAESVFAERIIQGMLDTDFYKLTVMQAVLHNYPDAEVEWELRCDEDLTPYLAEIRYQIERLAEISATPDQLGWLGKIPFITPDFTRFLSLFRFNLRYVHTGIEAGQLYIRLRGPWLHVTLYEVPLLAIISEVRNRYRHPAVVIEQVRERLYLKLDALRAEASASELAGLQLADVGSRRRFSYRVQEEVANVLKHDFPGRLVGTSNVHLARELGLKPIGTMAHEWLMAHQQLGPRLVDSQSAALDRWVREYRGLPGIALTDCITLAAFLRDFDLYFGKLFDGLRHASGDPLVWAHKVIAHYTALGIDPMTKTLVFSDGLDLHKALALYRALKGQINVSFAIGTHLSCDIPGVTPLNIVIKMAACNGQPVARVSDSPGKTQCRDENFVAYLKHVFRV
ncbi:nicotinate phosphoribosyltransferase [Pseudomonas typographi]|uniref:nicotinate phosphoribosyltransferase n=1 Tax=Pseudomonas typographi TaxID=2715964 RepID=UPI001683FF19|nr:nicotinate phosphoribosyltransferase [Pseudomonas typographi]MBD1552757.1 nicotinate phosphoribosyltransferase [Pseudomonas typographi]